MTYEEIKKLGLKKGDIVRLSIGIRSYISKFEYLECDDFCNGDGDYKDSIYLNINTGKLCEGEVINSVEIDKIEFAIQEDRDLLLSKLASKNAPKKWDVGTYVGFLTDRFQGNGQKLNTFKQITRHFKNKMYYNDGYCNSLSVANQEDYLKWFATKEKAEKFVAENKNSNPEVKVGDYIVLTGYNKGSKGPYNGEKNFIYKIIKMDCTKRLFFKPNKCIIHTHNQGSNPRIYRLATSEEIKMYEDAGKPVDVTKYQIKKKYNNWYYIKSDPKYLAYCHDNGKYGFDSLGNWFGDLPKAVLDDKWVKASDELVRERLLEYAKKHYPSGTKVKLEGINATYTIFSGNVLTLNYCKKETSIYSNGGYIYKNGKWAEKEVEYKECEECGGEGTVLVGKLYPSGHTEVQEDCSECQGEGEVEIDYLDTNKKEIPTQKPKQIRFDIIKEEKKVEEIIPFNLNLISKKKLSWLE